VDVTPAFSLTVALVGDPTGRANGYKEALYIPWSQRVRVHLHVPWSATVGEVRRVASRALGIPVQGDHSGVLLPSRSERADDLSWYDGLGGDTASPPVVDDLGRARWPTDDFPYRYWLNAHAVGIYRYVGTPGRAYLVIAEPDPDTPLVELFVIVEWPEVRASYEKLRRVVAPIALEQRGTWEGGAAANVLRFVAVLDARVDQWTAQGCGAFEFSGLLYGSWDADVLRSLLDLDAAETEDVLRGTGHALHGGTQWQSGGSQAAKVNDVVFSDVMEGAFPETDADVLARWHEVVEGVRKSDPIFV